MEGGGSGAPVLSRSETDGRRVGGTPFNLEEEESLR